jgi:dienelactone hydrolase
MAENKKNASSEKQTPVSIKAPDKNIKKTTAEEKLSPQDYIQTIRSFLDENNIEMAKKSILDYINSGLECHKSFFEKYHVLIQFHDTSLERVDADKIYASLKQIPKDDPKDILLVLYSFGGDVASAYLIAKLCREFTKEKVVIAVPRLAKSAATLICCGADEIHMGSLSELGPIDPQIGGLPALGLKNTIEQIAETTSHFPNSSFLFSEYLAKTVNPIHLGVFDRIVESASQYAQRLLEKHCKRITSEETKRIADRLVYEYKDHGFVIDKGEAMDCFGKGMIQIDTPEYLFSDGVYSLLSSVLATCGTKYKFSFIGSCNSINSIGLSPAPKMQVRNK